MGHKSKFNLKDAREKLSGSRFRDLNETLYKQSSKDSFKLFSENPQLFMIYHDGFNRQANVWPCNPLDFLLKRLRKLDPKLVIGDFGCGEARIANTLIKRKVYSFDLVAVNDSVIACNIANLPLDDSSLDVGIFCLSLMGKDWPKFINEASRCIKIGGILYIIEVTSRLVNKVKFIKFISKFGYKLNEANNIGNNFFIYLQFVKTNVVDVEMNESDLLAPCLYKRR